MEITHTTGRKREKPDGQEPDPIPRKADPFIKKLLEADLNKKSLEATPGKLDNDKISSLLNNEKVTIYEEVFNIEVENLIDQIDSAEKNAVNDATLREEIDGLNAKVEKLQTEIECIKGELRKEVAAKTKAVESYEEEKEQLRKAKEEVKQLQQELSGLHDEAEKNIVPMLESNTDAQQKQIASTLDSYSMKEKPRSDNPQKWATFEKSRGCTSKHEEHPHPLLEAGGRTPKEHRDVARNLESDYEESGAEVTQNDDVK